MRAMKITEISSAVYYCTITPQLYARACIMRAKSSQQNQMKEFIELVALSKPQYHSNYTGHPVGVLNVPCKQPFKYYSCLKL